MGYARESYPAPNFAAVTPHASNNITPANPRALYVGVGGDVVIVGRDNTTEVTFKNVPSGTVLPVQALRVDDSSTATDIVALY